MVDLARIECPVILRGNQSTTYRDPVIPSTRFPATTTRPPASSPCADAGSVRHGTNATWKALAEKMQMRPENLHLQLRRPIPPPGAALYDQWNGRDAPTDSKFHR